MSVFLNMKNMKDRVEYLLRKTPRLQDSDNKLVATFWWHEMGKEQTQLMTGYDFLEVLSQGKLSSSISIVRVRRKLQEQYPELRGEMYIQREKESEEVRQNIHKL
jgi:hypothetical protein